MAKLIKGLNDLSTVRPDLAKQWHPTKNGNLLPSDFTCGSNKKVWWKDEFGHEWQTSIGKRISGQNCPYCSGQKLLKGFNDIKTIRPDLAKQWHPTKNGNLTPSDFSKGSEEYIWWICPKGHEWKAQIKNRFHGRNCPICSSEKNTSFPEQAIYYYLSKYFDAYSRYKIDGFEADIYLKKEKIAIEYDGGLYHSSDEAAKKEKKKDDFFISKGITIIRVKENRSGPPILIDKNIIWYKANSEYTFLPLVIKELFRRLSIQEDVVLDNDRTLIYEKYLIEEKENSLPVQNPKLMEEWHPTKNGTINPEYIRITSTKKIWWLCNTCGNEWQARVDKRNKGNGCPICAGRKIIAGFNDLQTLKPDIAKEWHPTKNGKLSPTSVPCHSSKKVWWICPTCGGSYCATINNRSFGYGCPFCAGQKLLKGFNDLQTKYPELAEEFMCDKNNTVPCNVFAGGTKTYFWKCKNCGNIWKARIGHRIAGFCNCKVCNKKRMSIIFGKKVMLIETGCIFDSIREAARYIQKPSLQQNIGLCCKGKRQSAGGYHWKYVD